jgi:hypothetical protein
MVDWAESLGGLLQRELGVPFTVVDEVEPLSMLLFLPNTRGIIVAPMSASEMQGLGAMLREFFDQGGAALGFSPCTDLRKEPELASSVFPLFCNNSRQGTFHEGRLTNAYVVWDRSLAEGLPDVIELVSSGHLYASDSKGNPLGVPPVDGERFVFYVEEETTTPLVVGYRVGDSGRSVGFAGCRVNDVPRSSTYFGHLVSQSEFRRLFTNAVAWAVDGSPRYENLEHDWETTLAWEASRRTRASERARETRQGERVATGATLAATWTGAIVASLIIAKKVVKGPW